jgi:hypothetical protein
MSSIPISIVPKTCRFCTEPSIDMCKHCGQEFCQIHRSKYNPKLCSSCATDSNMQLEVGPITESDGATHQGRQFKLIGEGWPRAVTLLSEMTDEELEAHINELDIRLKEAQKTLDYTRILKSAAEFDKSQRVWSRAIAARKRREKIQEQGQIKLNGRAHKPKAQQSAAEILAKTCNITLAEAEVVLRLVGRGK